MELLSLADELRGNSYPGRGIVAGRSEDGAKAVVAYFIMGRSANSRNRIFVPDGDGLRVKAFDESKVTDPSLIIYSPVKVLGAKTIVTNGDQTDTIYDGLDRQMTFEQSLRARVYEPDAPHFTPRVSAVLHVNGGVFNFALSIIKKCGDGCARQTFAYENPPAGEGRFIHTYARDGNPLPSFEGEPARVGVQGGVDEFTDLVWNSLDDENKISLFARFIDIKTGKAETRIVNKNS